MGFIWKKNHMLKITLQSFKMASYLLSFSLFMVTFTTLDFLNISYQAMYLNYGIVLVIVNIILNLIMALLSAVLIELNTIMLDLKGIKLRGSSLSFIAVIVGVLTYGCTPCVISFFASLGIAFSVAVLPYAGLPYKLISLTLIVVGVLWTYREMYRNGCTIRIRREND